MELPREKKVVINKNPRFLILMSKPKVGKTTLIEGLDNCLHVDFEKGSNFVKTQSIAIDKYSDLLKLLGLLKKEKETKGEIPYEYIVLDTATSLETLALHHALGEYRKKDIGKNFGVVLNPDGSIKMNMSTTPPTPIYRFENILNLPKGAGYYWLRNSFQTILGWFEPYCKYMILMGHIKDSMIEVDGKEVSEVSIDLAGKLSSIVPSKADAVGYLYRKKDSVFASFDAKGDSIIGGRCHHLRGKHIEVSKAVRDENGDITDVEVFMDKIFI